MAVRTWSSSGSTDMNDTANWSGSGAFLTSDDLVWDATSVVNSTATAGLSVKSLTVASTYTGTFNDGGQTLTLAGGFNLDDSGAGTVTLTGTISVSVAGTWVSTAVLNNLTVTSGVATFTLSGTVSVAGTLTCSHTGNITLNTGTLDLRGNVGGAGTGTFGTNGSANITFTGTAAQTFSSAASSFGGAAGSITINKASNKISLGAAGNFRCTGFTITSGELDCVTYSFATSAQSAGGFLINGGTFTGGTNSITLSGFSMSSGTYTATSGTTSQSISFTVSGGTFNHNNGTFSFAAPTSGENTITCTQSFYTVSVANTLNGNAGLGANLTVTNNFTIGGNGNGFNTHGYNIAVTNQLSIPFVVFTNTGDETITYGTLVLGTTSTIVYAATSGTRNIRAWTYANLKINGSGGTFTLGGAITCTGTLTITAGSFTHSSQVLTVGSFSYQGGTVTLPFVLTFTGGSAFTFPAASNVIST